MGAGKTSVGLILARRLRFEFVDTDDLIETRAKKSIAEIFATEGEAAFRELERDICLSVPEKTVVALGGGAFMNAAVRQDIQRRGVSVFLDWPFEVLAQRIGDDPARPLSASGPDLNRRFRQRRPEYLQADIVWKSKPPHDESPEEVADAVLDLLNGHGSWKTT